MIFVHFPMGFPFFALVSSHDTSPSPPAASSIRHAQRHPRHAGHPFTAWRLEATRVGRQGTRKLTEPIGKSKEKLENHRKMVRKIGKS